MRSLGFFISVSRPWECKNLISSAFSTSGLKRFAKRCYELCCQVNGETVLAFEYDRINRTETILDRQHEDLMMIQYDASGRIIQVLPRRPVDGIRVVYDQQSHITKLTRGAFNVTAAYDDRGRLLERRFLARTVYRYSYKNITKVGVRLLYVL
jgi:YD repeat-containing protein